MKSATFFAVLLLCVHLSLQLPQLQNCPPDFVLTESMADQCGTLTCDASGTFTSVGCGTWTCLPGKTLRFKNADNSKPFPECCGGPICAD